MLLSRIIIRNSNIVSVLSVTLHDVSYASNSHKEFVLELNTREKFSVLEKLLGTHIFDNNTIHWIFFFFVPAGRKFKANFMLKAVYLYLF